MKNFHQKKKLARARASRSRELGLAPLDMITYYSAVYFPQKYILGFKKILASPSKNIHIFELSQIKIQRSADKTLKEICVSVILFKIYFSSVVTIEK